MAVEMHADIQGMTKEMYEQGMAEVGAQLRAAPGFIAHFAGPMEGGYRVHEVWASQEDLDRWIQGTIMPMAQQVGIPPFQPTILQVDNVVTR